MRGGLGKLSRPALFRVACSASAMLSTSAKFVVDVDGVTTTRDMTSKDFLLELPPGAYTTARTCAHGSRIFEWETHVARTAASIDSMLLDSSATVSSQSIEQLRSALAAPQELRPRLDNSVAAAVSKYRQLHGDETELKITVLVSWQGGNGNSAVGKEGIVQSVEDQRPGTVACHIAPLPPLPKPPVRVEVRGAPRENAAAKDSSWVADRAPLEALMRSATVGDVNELLLPTEGGALLEGSQTNFYALRDGAVHTAGEGVLYGTVRRLLLEVCEREGIPVVLEPPLLDDVHTWEGALISSTSRLLLPIDELYVPKEGAPSAAPDLRARFDNGPGTLATRLQRLVASAVEAHSTPIAECDTTAS